MTRFAQFTEKELGELLGALVVDDGVRYEPEPGSVEERLVGEIEQERRARTTGVPPYIEQLERRAVELRRVDARVYGIDEDLAVREELDWQARQRTQAGLPPKA